MDCVYCSDPAVGYDEDDEPTCGDEDTCEGAVKPLITLYTFDEDAS